jgi:hypothetical protein
MGKKEEYCSSGRESAPTLEFVQLFECAAENNDPAHAGCYEKESRARFNPW